MLIKKHLSKASFFKKAFLSFLTITIIVSITLTSFLSAIYLKSINTLVENFYTTILSQTNYSVSYINEIAQRVSIMLYGDKSIISFLNLKEQDKLATAIACQTLRSNLLSSPYVESIYLYNSNINMILSTRNGEQESLEFFYDKDITSYLGDIDSIIKNTGKPITHSITFDGQKRDICSYILFESNKEKNAIDNALVINISVDALTKSIQDINSQNKLGFKFMVIDENGKLIGQSPIADSELNNYIINNFCKQLGSSNPHTLTTIKAKNSDTYFALYDSKNKNDWRIIGLVPQKAIFQDIKHTTVISILVAILTLLGCALIGLYLAKKLNSPIDTITRIVKGENVEKETIQTIKTTEFEFLASVFSSMKEQNLKFNKLKNETDYSLRQFFLNNIILGNTTDSLEKLSDLNLKYIINNQLCLCILKIDNYKAFLDSNNQKERWALRYAIVNIASEILSKYYGCEVFSKNQDKFVAIINCEKENSFNNFMTGLERILIDLQNKINENLQLSLTIAYSPFFRGVENLSKVYENIDNLVHQKIRYGNGQIFNPNMIDEVAFDNFNDLLPEEENLIEKIISGEKDDAINIYNNISDKLYEYNYNEIISYVIHLSYLIYNSVNRKCPFIKENFTSVFKSFLIDLSGYEVLSDINTGFNRFICLTCNKILQTKETQMSQTADIIALKSKSIIENNFSRKDLCLNTIAEEIGLSPSYVGALFKSVQGTSIAKYISDYRMEKIAYYLKTTKYPIAKIVEMAGLEMSNYFYTCFKKYFGMSLGKYKLTVLHLDDTNEA